MPELTLSPGNSLSYDYSPPEDGGFTFVCFNALTGDKGMWHALFGSVLEGTGHGLLAYNLRGQAGSAFTFTDLDVAGIVADARALIDHVSPPDPIHVGLSIGGLFGIEAHLAGGAATARGLVLITTGRRAGARLDWVNEAVVTAARTGGLDLVRDLYAPLLFNEEWQAENRANFLKPGGYTPLPDGDGSLLLLAAGGTANWDIAYESLTLPVLSVTGLQDRVFRDADDIDTLTARLPDVDRLDMPNAGHMVPVERPAELAGAILNFADSIRTGRRR
ncbi:MAG: alpha/beta hydrolase [Pseudomonadota bacterium]